MTSFFEKDYSSDHKVWCQRIVFFSTIIKGIGTIIA